MQNVGIFFAVPVLGQFLYVLAALLHCRYKKVSSLHSLMFLPTFFFYIKNWLFYGTLLSEG